MADFKIVSSFVPKGDQIKAIEELSSGLENGEKEMVLKGVTGSGKTFTLANIIAKTNRPALILEPNKTLAGQLYNEMKSFFPNNHVEYFVSYYDYYQPEAYVVSSDTYIAKDAKINDEIDELRHSATSSLINFHDTIVVSSVSCIYGIGDKEDYIDSMMTLRVGEVWNRKDLYTKLIEMQYKRNDYDFERSCFRVKGDTVEIIPPSEHAKGIRIEFFDDEIDSIKSFDLVTGKMIASLKFVNVFAATFFVTSKNKLDIALKRIKDELDEVHQRFIDEGKPLEAERIYSRTTQDIEMLKETGFCSGIENYSRHLSLREEGETPSTLIDFFSSDFICFVDESHVTIPQVRGMYNGDRSRKETLVNYGFRLPSALDNRPLKFDEFNSKLNQIIYVSATPSAYDIRDNNLVVEQIIRPTGLLDPLIEIRPTKGQVDDIFSEINIRIKKKERVLVTTLTIKMAEDLTAYLKKLGLKVAYLHTEVKALERLEILKDLREGKYDTLVGINLLREGLDLPEVSLVCILDADKKGFLRSESSLIQTFGRAARNSNGKVILYADTISEQMEEAIKETKRRREIQEKYNLENNIVPKTIIKPIPKSLTNKNVIEKEKKKYDKGEHLTFDEKTKLINELENEMKEYAKNLNFEEAAIIRDEILRLKGMK